MNFSDLAQPFARSQAPKARLPVRSNCSYMYTHHPKNWDLIILPIENPKKGQPKSKPFWLPNLTRLIEEPGCNNVRGTKDNPDSSIARTNLQDQGHTILHPLEHDYMRIYPAHLGNYHTTKFVKVEVLGGEMVTTTDREAFNKWKKELVSNGHINPPHPQILRRIMHRQQELIVMHASKPHIPHAIEMHKKAQTKLENMQLALDGVIKDGVHYYE